MRQRTMRIAAKLTPVVKRHKTLIRIVVFCGIIVVFVIIHENALTAIMVGNKALEVFTDVCADRVFPSSWFGDDNG